MTTGAEVRGFDLDDETGFYYYGHRYYAPELSRWTTRDPIGEDGVSLHDPLGESPREF